MNRTRSAPTVAARVPPRLAKARLARLLVSRISDGRVALVILRPGPWLHRLLCGPQNLLSSSATAPFLILPFLLPKRSRITMLSVTRSALRLKAVPRLSRAASAWANVPAG